MGDRGNIIIRMPDNKGQIVLYSHWGGHDLPFILQQALQRGKERWDDPQYLSRIIFSTMIAENPEGLTGYGISTVVYDNEHPLLVVTPGQRTVHLEADPNCPHTPRWPAKQASWTFEEWCALPAIGWDSVLLNLDEGEAMQTTDTSRETCIRSLIQCGLNVEQVRAILTRHMAIHAALTLYVQSTP